jgi:hypothetical protein
MKRPFYFKSRITARHALDAAQDAQDGKGIFFFALRAKNRIFAPFAPWR